MSPPNNNIIMPDESRLDLIPRILSCQMFHNDAEKVIAGMTELTKLCHTTRRREPPYDFSSAQTHEFNRQLAMQDSIERNHRAAVRDFGGHLAIVVSMKQHAGNPKLLACAMKFMTICALREDVPHSEAFQDLAVHVGAFEVCIEAMKRFPEEIDVQVWGVEALLSLSWCDRNAEPLIMEKQGLSAIVFAMNSFPESSTIQKACCAFLYRITRYSTEIREQIIAAGGRRVLLAAIENHPEDKDGPDSIQVNARNTMKALCEPADAPIDDRRRDRRGDRREPANPPPVVGLASSLFKKVGLF